MRIITGSARGTKLETLEGEAMRPTGGRVKEAVFSMIQFDIEGRRVLDLFAGSGQLALEALSRGAESAVIIDSSAEAIEIIKRNAKKTHLYDKCTISLMDYEAYLSRRSHSSGSATEGGFDIIFLDPPYNTDYLKKSLSMIAKGKIAKQNSIIVCESGHEDVFSGDEELAEKYRVLKKSRYGRVYITLLTPVYNA
ncbi:MAG TPA: 16S rRNA (guanine(966)-N(2))-methyltransferase RsmD [Bacillota bacterium]|nr:16S rRNA (guanine(966)-N(2))-methyltransferase RsmD [Bacillota bacterium]